MIDRSPGYPHRLGPYVLVERLGRGGMGQISLAMTGSRGREALVVIKRVLPTLIGNREFRQRFRDEATLVRRLAHTNLVRTFAVGEEDGQPYIAQEFIDGHDLSEVLRRATIDQREVPIGLSVHIVREIARGLSYAHEFEDLRLIHRDISPANIRLTYEGDVKLIDFGLASSSEKTVLTAPHERFGRFAYMAPEQLSDGAIDRRVDLYALGILLWEMITDRPMGTTVRNGQVVLPQTDGAAAIERIEKGAPAAPSELNPAVPSALDRVVLRSLAREPNDRFQTATELRSALRPFLPLDDDPDVLLSAFMTGLFDVEKERASRRALVAAAWNQLPDESEPSEESLATSLPDRSSDRSAPAWRRPALGAVLMAAGAAAGVGATAVARHWDAPGRPVSEATAPRPAPAALPVRAAPSPPLAPVTTPATSRDAVFPSPLGRVTSARPPSRTPPIAPSSTERAPGAAAPAPTPSEALSLASAAYQRGQFERAVQLAHAAVKGGVGAPAEVVLGNAYLSQRRLAEAERAYAAALAEAPGDARTIELLALVRELRKSDGEPPP